MKACPLIASAVVALALPLQAATLLEFDYKTAVSGTDVAAVAATSGASTTATIYDSATVNTGSTGLSSGIFVSEIANGYMSVPRTLNSGIQMKATSGNNNEFRDYSTGSGTLWGSGTISLVFQPNFTNAGSSRYTFFANHAGGTTTDSTFFYLDGSSLKFALGLGGTNGSAVRGAVAVAAPVWDTSKWYYLAASYDDNEVVTIYVRELTEEMSGTGSYAASATTLAAHNGPSVRAPSIGVRSNQSGDLIGENANGKIAYFLWTDQYAGTQADFDAQYASLYNAVPEPGSLALAVLGCAGVWVTLCRRRKTAQLAA